MSNLSDLLPAGGGAKVITATADGNLATGQTVALQSNGTVKAIAANGLPEALGSQTVFSTASTTRIASCYDPDTGKTIIAYRGASNYGYALVATPASDNSITFGTPVTFLSGTLTEVALSYDTGQDKVLLVYSDGADGNKLKAITGTVSGTSISFSSSSTAETNSSENIAVAYSPDSENHMVIYADGGNSDRGAARVIAVSGAGAPTTYNVAEVLYNGSNTTQSQDVVYDTTQNKFIVFYRDAGNSYYGECAVGSISGTTITFGTSVVLNSDNTTDIALAFDSSNEKTVVLYKAGQDPRSRVISVSGTTPSAGSETVIVSLSGSGQYDLVYDSSAGKLIAIFDNEDDSEGEYAVGTVSGTSITYLTPVTFNSDGRAKYNGASFNASVNKVVLAFEDIGNSSYGTAQVLQMIGTNSQDFVGITNQAINNSASGEVVVEGGVITNGSLLPAVVTPSVNGSQIIHNTDLTYYTEMAYDTANDKLVLAYQDRGSSGSDTVGKAVVATISGDSISLGTPVTFDSNIGAGHGICYDSNSGKIVIAYQDAGDSQKGKTLVGTVSGTSISFGSENTFLAQRSERVTCVFDSSVNKVLIVYRNQDNSNYGTAIAGTVSGTSMTFGSAVVWESTAADNFTGTYDTNQNASIIAYTTTSNGNKVAKFTVSSSSVIAGYGNNGYYTGGASTSAVSDISVAYDSTANRSIIAFSDSNNSSYGTATVADFSGGGVPTFGTPVVFNAAATGYVQIADDPVNGLTLIAYKDSGDGDDGTVLTATVSGTSLTYGSEVEFDPDVAFPWDLIRDPDGGKFVVAYLDEIGGSGGNYDGSLITITMTSSFPNLAIGSTYYVQDDGTLSTTSSSVTAGKAIANTTLLLKG